jgi:hypothetical protein
MEWVQVYDLRNEAEYVRQVQHATLNTEEFGLEPEHGLFGSNEWWTAVDNAAIPVIVLTGRISRIYMGSMNDWPEVEIDADGSLTRWTRYGLKDLYEVGRPIEVRYVLQKWRSNRNVDILGEFSKNLLTMRIGIPEMKEN